MLLDDSLLFLLDSYSWLTDMYVIDHFVEDNWNKIPNSWKIELEDYEVLDWASFLDISSPLCRPLPLSLYCLRYLIKLLTISRKAVSSPKEVIQAFGINSFSGLQDINCFPSALCDQLKRKVKLKKEHEISRVLEVVQLLKNNSLERLNFDTIIDVGAGLGHLSRLLAINLTDVNVVAVESDVQLVASSSRMDSYIKRRSRTSIRTPQRQVEYITSDTKNEAFSEDASALLLGLHPCGNLSPSIIRIFNNLSSVSAVMLFGCCYHKLNDGFDKLFHNELCNLDQSNNRSCSLGFPMSYKYRDVSLSYAARELACHAIEKFIMNLKIEAPYSHKVHCYRAALEWLIVNCGWMEYPTQKRHLGLKGVKKAHEMTFLEYARKALFGREDLLNAVMRYVKSDQSAQNVLLSIDLEAKRVLAIYCLRLLVALLVETLIINDRLEFLKENGHTVTTIPLFEPLLSPRNIAIVGWKNK